MDRPDTGSKVTGAPSTATPCRTSIRTYPSETITRIGSRASGSSLNFESRPNGADGRGNALLLLEPDGDGFLIADSLRGSPPDSVVPLFDSLGGVGS